jgi:signal transduction histidine kinase
MKFWHSVGRREQPQCRQRAKSIMDEKDTILIVDDNPTNLGVLFDYLRESGFKVLIAQDGEGALQRALYAKPDIILLDVMMPGINGFETCRQLKKNADTADIPVIFMTALSETVDKVRGFKLGAVDYVTKPLQHEEVLARIQTHLTVRKQNKELDAFAHTVAHDLQNPLGMIISYTHILLEDLPKIETAETLDILYRVGQAGQKMNNIIQALLLLSGVRKAEVQLTPLDMADVVGQSLQRLDSMVVEYQGEIVLPETWPVATGYAPWVEEVWVNYLSNGLKYGGKPPCLELGATFLPDGMISFWVKDNGQGLSSQQQDALFTEFIRLNEVRVEGHGLGLSIVHRIVTKLGGQVGVESKAGEGCKFYFTLPAYKD